MSEFTVLNQHVSGDSMTANLIPGYDADAKKSATQKGYNINMLNVNNCQIQDKQDFPSMATHKSSVDHYFFEDSRVKDLEGDMGDQHMMNAATHIQRDLPQTYSEVSKYREFLGATRHMKEPNYICTTSKQSASTEEQQRKGKVDDQATEHDDDDSVGSTKEDTNETSNEGVNDFPNLSEQEILRKLNDSEVTKQLNVINSLRDINIANLHKLEQLDRTDPAVKRILMRPRLTAREVKEVDIDADIKATVNEFLGTNVTGHFIMARVLRENYKTFYSWMTAHIQVERNAWASRLKQALQMIDVQRRENLEIKDLVVESTKRIQHLIMSFSQATKSIDAKEKICQTSSHTLTRRLTSRDLESAQARLHGSGMSSVANNDTRVQERKQHSFKQLLKAMGTLKETTVEGNPLSNSSSDEDDPITPSNSAYNSNSDPDVCSLSEESYRQHSNVDTYGRLTHSKSFHATTECFLGEVDREEKSSIRIQPDAEEMSNKGIKHTSSDKGATATCNNEATDWGLVMRDGLDALTELCERLLNDHMSLLCLPGRKSDDCSNLVKTVCTSIHERRNKGQNINMDTETRLGALETENRSLQNELKDLKSVLAKKNNEAFNFQNQFERQEALLNDSKQAKINKCLNVDYLVTSRSQISRRNKKGFNSTEKVYDGLKNDKTTNKSYLKDTKTQSINDVQLIMPHSIKLTPEDRVQFYGAKNSKYNRSNSLFLPSDANSMSSSEQLVTDRPERMQKRLKIRTNKDPLRGIPTVRDIIAKDEEEEKSYDCQIIVNSGLKVPFVQNNMSRPTNANTSYRRQWQHSSHPVYGTAKPRPEPIHGGINKKHSGGSLEHLNGLGKDLVNDVQDLSKTRLPDGQSAAAGTHATETINPNLYYLPHVTDTHSDGTPELNMDNGYQSHKRNDESSTKKNGDYPQTVMRRNLEHNGTSLAKLRSSIQTNVLSLASSHTKETTPVLPKVRQNGNVVVSKCLRCQKLCNSVDNHKQVCSVHREQVDPSAKMIQLANQWTCCLQPGDSEGSYCGQHI